MPFKLDGSLKTKDKTILGRDMLKVLLEGFLLEIERIYLLRWRKDRTETVVLMVNLMRRWRWVEPHRLSGMQVPLWKLLVKLRHMTVINHGALLFKIQSHQAKNTNSIKSAQLLLEEGLILIQITWPLETAMEISIMKFLSQPGNVRC